MVRVEVITQVTSELVEPSRARAATVQVNLRHRTASCAIVTRGKRAFMATTKTTNRGSLTLVCSYSDGIAA